MFLENTLILRPLRAPHTQSLLRDAAPYYYHLTPLAVFRSNIRCGLGINDVWTELNRGVIFMASKEEPPSGFLACIDWWHLYMSCLWCPCLCPHATDQRPGGFPRSLREPFPDSSSLAPCSSLVCVPVCTHLTTLRLTLPSINLLDS
jgi:hypothetical protein